jgi:hypothetical protein
MILEDKILDFIESKSKIADAPLDQAVEKNESKGEASEKKASKKEK